MPNTPDFIAHLLELMRPAGKVSARAMFGGHCIYVDAMIVGIVVDDELYLKTDDDTRAAFVERALPPFCYSTREGARHAMSYHRAPDEAMESPAAMREWLRPAVGVALRAANRKTAPARKRRPRSGGT